MLSRFITAACSGITSERNTIISSSAREQHDDADEQRQLVPERRREVDRAGGHAADVDGHPRVRLRAAGSPVAQAFDELGGRVCLGRGVRVDRDRRHVRRPG